MGALNIEVSALKETISTQAQPRSYANVAMGSVNSAGVQHCSVGASITREEPSHNVAVRAAWSTLESWSAL